MLNSALVLCAGLGTRMRPITQHTPKPLVKVAGKSLLFYHLERLQQAGIKQVVINTFWLGEQIIKAVEEADTFDLTIRFSREIPLMETAGGVKKALSYIEDDTFLVINGDIWCDMPIESIDTPTSDYLANLVMVTNPSHNPNGDFAIDDGILSLEGANKRTFSGIAVYRRAFFDPIPLQPESLSPWFRHWIATQQLQGQEYMGKWCDVGTPQRLYALDQELTACQ